MSTTAPYETRSATESVLDADARRLEALSDLELERELTHAALSPARRRRYELLLGERRRRDARRPA